MVHFLGRRAFQYLTIQGVELLGLVYLVFKELEVKRQRPQSLIFHNRIFVLRFDFLGEILVLDHHLA